MSVVYSEKHLVATRGPRIENSLPVTERGRIHTDRKASNSKKTDMGLLFLLQVHRPWARGRLAAQYLIQ